MAKVVAKNRINVSFSDEETHALSRISKRDQLPVATKVAQLVRFALELEEDLHFARLSDLRLGDNELPHVSHADAWR